MGKLAGILMRGFAFVALGFIASSGDTLLAAIDVALWTAAYLLLRSGLDGLAE